MPIVKLGVPSSWMKMHTDIYLDEMRHYLDTIHSQFVQILNDFEKRVDEEAKKINDEKERDEFYEWHSDDYWRYKESFPRLFLNSLFVSIYSIFETQLESIAKALKKSKKEVFSFSDIKRGNYIESARKYIHVLTSIDIKNVNVTLWAKLGEYQQIRNIIVHENGKTENRTMIVILKDHAIYDEDSKEISISKTYAKEFINQLYSELEKGKHL